MGVDELEWGLGGDSFWGSFVDRWGWKIKEGGYGGSGRRRLGREETGNREMRGKQASSRGVPSSLFRVRALVDGPTKRINAPIKEGCIRDGEQRPLPERDRLSMRLVDVFRAASGSSPERDGHLVLD